MSKLKLTSMNRRAFVMSSAVGALSSAALLAFNAADAKEAMFGNKAAAWYRFKLGDFEATVGIRRHAQPRSRRGALFEDAQGRRSKASSRASSNLPPPLSPNKIALC